MASSSNQKDAVTSCDLDQISNFRSSIRLQDAGVRDLVNEPMTSDGHHSPEPQVQYPGWETIALGHR